MNFSTSTSSNKFHQWLWALSPSIMVFALVILTCGIVLSLPAHTQEALLTERGFFENLTIWAYVSGFLALALRFPTPRKFLTHIYFPYLTLALMFREMDFDKIPFTYGMLHILQYTGDDVPTLERVISIALVLILLAMFCTMVWRHFGQFWRALLRFDMAAWSFMGMLGFGATAKTLDGISRKLRDFGINISDDTAQLALAYEEIAETAIAIMLLLTVLFTFKRFSQTREIQS